MIEKDCAIVLTTYIFHRMKKIIAILGLSLLGGAGCASQNLPNNNLNKQLPTPSSKRSTSNTTRNITTGTDKKDQVYIPPDIKKNEVKFYSERIRSSTQQGKLVYKNEDFGVEFLVPDTISEVREYSNKKIGEAALVFKDKNLGSGVFNLHIRNEKEFKTLQEAEPGDIAYYDWDSFRENYINKIITKSTELSPFEKEKKINGFNFLNGYYYNPELDYYVNFFTTYNKSTEIQFEYTFSVDWYAENFASYPENSNLVLNDLAKGKIVHTPTLQALKLFEKIVSGVNVQ